FQSKPPSVHAQGGDPPRRSQDAKAHRLTVDPWLCNQALLAAGSGCRFLAAAEHAHPDAACPIVRLDDPRSVDLGPGRSGKETRDDVDAQPGEALRGREL